MRKEPTPLKLKIVAYLFLLSGVSSVLRFFILLFHNSFMLDFGVLGIPICFGLLRYRPAWRTLALVFIWIMFVLSPMLFFGKKTYFEIMGIYIGEIPRSLFYVCVIVGFSLTLWQYRVLTKPSIKQLFYESA